MDNIRELVIQVLNPPESFPDEGIFDLKLVSQGKKELLPGQKTDDGLEFRVPIQIREDGRPAGPFVYRYGDQRSFVYLQWWGRNSANQYVTFRRIKLYFDQLPEWPSTNVVTISGTDRKGHPACSTAIIV